jgi:hypothetical protein
MEELQLLFKVKIKKNKNKNKNNLFKPLSNFTFPTLDIINNPTYCKK